METQGRSLEVGTKVDATDEGSLLACFLWLALLPLYTTYPVVTPAQSGLAFLHQEHFPTDMSTVQSKGGNSST